MQRGEKRAEVIDAISEEEFLKNYNPADYDRPSVTVDILVFTLSERGELSLLLIERGNHPFKGHWALPGGFVVLFKCIQLFLRSNYHLIIQLNNYMIFN